MDEKTINQNKTASAENPADRYGWIGEGLPELREGDINIVLKDTVKIPADRYEELIEAESVLKVLCRFIGFKRPYDIDAYRIIAGKYMPQEKEEAEE